MSYTFHPPDRVTYSAEKRTSRLTFLDSYAFPWGTTTLTGDYLMRGGVCWPKLTGGAATSGMMGFAVLCGLDMKSRRVIVFEERSFVSIDPTADDAGREWGIAQWFNSAWAKYFARFFFWSGQSAEHFRYLKQVVDSNLIAPKPGFYEIDIADPATALQVCIEWQLQRRLFMRSRIQGELAQAWNALSAGPPPRTLRETPPAIHALLAAVAGLDQHAPRKPKE